jgi:hypothetical protein
MLEVVVFGGEMASALASVLEVRGLNPGRGRWNFKGDTNPQRVFLCMGSKAVGPMPYDLTASSNTLQV